MSENEKQEHTERAKDHVKGRGDDEREHREQIEMTGEPSLDSLGNADGAS